jgi:5-formyltetrahydrofolate cyclo-ligase
VSNCFGIPEPAGASGRWLRGAELDVVLAPLVAFDRAGHRLGMGGGFYDRTFRFVVRRAEWRRPWIIGLAYDFQRVDALPVERWDVPLHAVVTESGAQLFQRDARVSGDSRWVIEDKRDIDDVMAKSRSSRSLDSR